MAQIKIENLNISVKKYSENSVSDFLMQPVFKNYNFYADENNITGILAPSGFGKTTLLNWIAGILDENFVYNPYQNFGKISYAFQEPRLIPNLTVFENIVLPLKNIYEKEKSESEALFFLKKMELMHKKDVFPFELSGGEKQRACVARAFAFPSDVLLMDEPFQSLDKELKFRILNDLKHHFMENPKTILFVSHDEEELSFFCNKIIKL